MTQKTETVNAPTLPVSALPAAQVVPGWWKKYTVWLATIGVILPDLLQWALDNIELLGMVGAMSDETKGTMRLVIMALIPVAAAWKQRSVVPAPERGAP